MRLGFLITLGFADKGCELGEVCSSGLDLLPWKRLMRVFVAPSFEIEQSLAMEGSRQVLAKEMLYY